MVKRLKQKLVLISAIAVVVTAALVLIYGSSRQGRTYNICVLNYSKSAQYAYKGLLEGLTKRNTELKTTGHLLKNPFIIRQI